ncbi:MAG TPA: TIM barrel protein [Jiangellaceae bacterium]|nr:TIM barrel protein [Jiangellaceae bacterium]
MALDKKISRRQLLGAGGAAAAVATLAPFSRAAALAAPAGGPGGGRLIPAAKVGTITFTQRDVPGRLGVATGSPTMGYLGGANFPADPTDLGPLVPLPGGWKELLEYLARVGFEQIEFAGYGQNAANPGGAAPNPVVGGAVTPESAAAYLAYGRTLRGFLDDNGLEAIGNHGFIPNTWPGPSSAGGAMSTLDRDRWTVELEFASVLGMPFMGTGGDPTGSSQIEQWDIAAEKWEALNTLALPYGISIYPHNHDPAYGFVQDGPMVTVTVARQTGLPLETPQVVRGESGLRKMQAYLDRTDPDLCRIEMDIYWAYVAQHIHRWRYDWEGNRVEDIFDPLAQVAKQPLRYPLYHAKDGDSTGQALGVGQGYTMIPFGDPRSDIDFATFFKNQGARGSHNPDYEQDNAPGGAADPGQSLRFSAISAHNMNTLRG